MIDVRRSGAIVDAPLSRNVTTRADMDRVAQGDSFVFRLADLPYSPYFNIHDGVTKRDAPHFDTLGLSAATIGELAGAMVSEVFALDNAPAHASHRGGGEFFIISFYHMTEYSYNLIILI